MTIDGRSSLRSDTLARARATVPDYDRSATPTIAHVGVGAFARAHLGTYADDLLRLGGPGLVRGVSIRTDRAERELRPQDGLYTVAVREPGAAASLRVIGALASMETGPAAAIEAMTAPATRLVTLTITEKGYAAVAGESPASGSTSSVPTLIALALAQRRRAGLAPPVIASLDNLADNGSILRARVGESAHMIDPSLADWIAEEVSFPSSVVDRMVPASTPQDREHIAGQLGLLDRAAVSTEQHRSWIIQSTEALTPLAEVGVELVDDVGPFEQRKLWLLNGPHSAVAYGGLLAGCDTVARAVTEPSIARFVRHLVDDTLEVARFPVALEPDTFAAEALRRFANPTLGHTCAQVGADGSSKLPQRLLPVVAARQARGLDTTRFAVVVAIWVAATASVGVRGANLPRLEDPLAVDLGDVAAARQRDLHRLSHVALAGRTDPGFVDEVASTLRSLTTEGFGLLERRA